MKVLRSILKYVLCIFLTYSVIFTIINIDKTAEGIAIMRNSEHYYNELFNEENIQQSNDTMNGYFLENENRDNKLVDLYNKYPAGTVYMANFYYNTISNGETAIVSMILSLIMGTAVYLLVNSKEKKGVKLVIAFYLLSVFILGFIQGLQDTLGEFKWIFPDEYIIPITVAFGLVIAVRIIKQKDLANKLNKKLKEIKK